jgi:hypothetical protein
MQVLEKLQMFETPDGAKPFAKVTADDVILINYSTNLLGWFSRLIPALQTDTEVSTAAATCGGWGCQPAAALHTGQHTMP